MSATPMSLESLQFLLKYMDANRRFEIFNRCPALRAIERSVPLTINDLTLSESSVTVNDTTYKFGIIRKYNVGESPKYVTDSNEIGGLTHEVDKYGIKDVLDKYLVTPGDVGINLPREPRMQNEDDHIRNLENQIQQLIIGGGVGKTLEALAPIIHESSFPLKKLDNTLLSVEDATNPIVRAAETLKTMMIQRNILQFVSALTNPMVFIILLSVLSEQTLEELIENWIESNRPIGTEHTIMLHQEPRFVDEMEGILKRFNGVPIDDENVIIPMSNTTQLKVSYGSFPEFAPRSHWAVRFLTEAIQY
ncbi:unnamed protein product [Caenorhabditis brenneri]